jgi:protein tyrosine/serine phosphatase
MKPDALVARINKLPKWARDYIHHLSTRVDPQGEIEELVQLRDQRRQLIKLIAELKAENRRLRKRRGASSAVILSLLLVSGSYSQAQVPTKTEPLGSSYEQRKAGSTLAHFGKVDDGVYKGSRPRSDADFRFLQSRHVKYILDLQLIPSLLGAEQKRAKRYGMKVIHARINASPMPPAEKHIALILAILRDSRYRPIYFHCALGRDRTALVAALYKMYFMGMSQQDAWRYMKGAGFKEAWIRNGLKNYLQNHPTPPQALHPPFRG